MIKLNPNLTIEQATTTTDFPVKPEDVVAAYDKSGLNPVRGAWVDFRQGCACALGAMSTLCPRPPGWDQLSSTILETFEEGDVLMLLFGQSMDDRTPELAFIHEFAEAFDYNSMDLLRSEVDAVIAQAKVPNSNWPPVEVLAWRNALAVREKLENSCLSPASFKDYFEV